MDRILTALTLATGAYLWAAIACAGLDVHLGPLHLKTQKLINPAFLFIVLLVCRALRTSPPAEGALEAERPQRHGRSVLLGCWLLAIVPVAVLAWGNALDGDFIREDFQRLAAVQGGAPFNGSVWADAGFQTFWSRQVSLALDAATYPSFGLDPRPWHALNLALHLIVALLAGLLAFDLTRRRSTALFATGLVALAPAAAEPVCWIAARDDTLAALFALVSALALVRAVRARGWGLRWMLLSVAASLCALFSKESALSLAGALVPLAWLADCRSDNVEYDAMRQKASMCGDMSNDQDGSTSREMSMRDELRRVMRAVARVVPHALVLIAYVTVRSRLLAAQGWQPGNTFTDWPKVLLWPLSPLGPLAFPVNMVEIGELYPWARALVAAGLVAGVGAAFGCRRALAQRTTLGLYAFLLLATVPVYRMIHLSATLQNNRYLYLPGVAWALFFAHLVVQAGRVWPRARLIPLVALGTAFALVRINAQPWVTAGAVASRLREDLKVLVEPLAREPRVRLDGLPDQWRGAFLFNLADASGPLVAFHGMPPVHRFRLVELYHEKTVRPPRRPGEPEFCWSALNGFVEVPDSRESTRR